MRSFICLSLLLVALGSLPGCHDELAQAEAWNEPEQQAGSFIGSGMPTEPTVEEVAKEEAPVRYQWVQKCTGNVCEWVQEPIPDSISTQRTTVRSGSSYRATPLRNFGSRVRGFFSRIRSRFSRGC